VGAALRILLQIGLFFKTKVHRNHYRFALFTFMFIYQFTGSFLTSLPEYVIWILCFSPVFPQFNTSLARQPEREAAPSLAALPASSAGSC
jgi:hypothetical protein